jgi:hypothetical protein
MKKILIISGLLLLLFSMVKASGSFAFITDGQSYAMASAPSDNSASYFGVRQIRQADISSLTSMPKNVPNPFKPKRGEGTTIIYNLSSDTGTKLIIYDITGQAIWQKFLAPGEEGGKAGQNNVFWNGKNDFGDYVGNGVYIYLITSGSKVLHIGHMAVMG